MIDNSPRSRQAADLLRTYMRDRKLGEGAKLPSEADVARQLGVSRNTLREAYVALESEGAIVRRHGLGTFVARPHVSDPLRGEGYGLFAQIEDAGYTPSSTRWRVEEAPPPLEAALALGVPRGRRVLRASRVLLADHAPAVYITDYFSPRVDTSALVNRGVDGNVLEYVLDDLGLRECVLRSRFQAARASAVVAEALELRPGTPLIEVVATVDDVELGPFSYAVAYLHPDVIRIDVERILRRR